MDSKVQEEVLLPLKTDYMVGLVNDLMTITLSLQIWDSKET